MNRELIVKAVALLVSYREYTEDCRIANACGEVVEALKAELAKPEQDKHCKFCNGIGCVVCDARCLYKQEPDVTFIDEGNKQEPVAYWNGKDGFIRADQTKYVSIWSDYYPEPLYASPPVSVDNSAKSVNEFHPDWDMIKPMVERIVELELEIRDFERDVSTNFQNLDTSGQCTRKSDESIREVQRLGQELGHGVAKLDENSTLLAQRLLAARLSIHPSITQSQIAKELGRSRSAVCLWEKGKTEPSAGNLVKLASIYKVSIEWLLGAIEYDSKELNG